MTQQQPSQGQQASQAEVDAFILASRVPLSRYGAPEPAAQPTSPAAAPAGAASHAAIDINASTPNSPQQRQATEAPKAAPAGAPTAAGGYSYSQPWTVPPLYTHGVPPPAGYPPQQPGTAPPAGYPPQQQGQPYPYVMPVAYVPAGEPMACGCGLQLTLFLIGWLFSPCWWAGAFIYCCQRQKDRREKGWWVANVIASIVSVALLVTLIVLVATGYWSGIYTCTYRWDSVLDRYVCY